VQVTIDPGAGEAVFEQIATQVAAQIASGALRTGERLPAARDLAAALGANVHTVLHAYQRLRDEGWIELRRGRGAVVVASPVGAPLERAVAAVVTEARAAGLGLPALIALVRKEFPA